MKIFLLADVNNENRYLIWLNSKENIEKFLPPGYGPRLAEINEGNAIPPLESSKKNIL